tara:strand:+ start:16198 stop:17106 length:909 start_codon:yes stop_codon:yes gene_type:complete
MELVSVIIPTYNRARLLKRALKSVSEQTYKNIEIIVVDDCSNDGTVDLLKEYPDTRMRFFKTDYNMKASAARNVGIEMSKGRYLTFLDSDDEYMPSKVEEQYAIFKRSRNRKLGVVTCGRKDSFEGDKKETVWLPKKRGAVLENLLGRDNVGAGTPFLMVSKEVFNDGFRFDPLMPAMQDHDFMINICQKYEIDFVPKALVRVHNHSGPRTYSNIKSIEAHEAQHEKYKLLYERYPNSLSKSLIALAEKYYFAGNQKRLFETLPDSGGLVHLWAAYFKVCQKPRSFMARVARVLLRKITFSR